MARNTMPADSTHNPDRFVSDLRLILSQGRKRIGMLVGAGAPASIRVDAMGKISETGAPLIPTVKGITANVLDGLSGEDKATVDRVKADIGAAANVENILSRIRLLANAIGTGKFYDKTGSEYEALVKTICDRIGSVVKAELPLEPTPYSELIGWISGTARRWPVEIFTTNYDLLFEEAFERAKVPYFDGFFRRTRSFLRRFNCRQR